jgi:hypothetical protein
MKVIEHQHINQHLHQRRSIYDLLNFGTNPSLRYELRSSEFPLLDKYFFVQT